MSAIYIIDENLENLKPFKLFYLDFLGKKRAFCVFDRKFYELLSFENDGRSMICQQTTISDGNIYSISQFSISYLVLSQIHKNTSCSTLDALISQDLYDIITQELKINKQDFTKYLPFCIHQNVMEEDVFKYDSDLFIKWCRSKIDKMKKCIMDNFEDFKPVHSLYKIHLCNEVNIYSNEIQEISDQEALLLALDIFMINIPDKLCSNLIDQFSLSEIFFPKDKNKAHSLNQNLLDKENIVANKQPKEDYLVKNEEVKKQQTSSISAKLLKISHGNKSITNFFTSKNA